MRLGTCLYFSENRGIGNYINSVEKIIIIKEIWSITHKRLQRLKETLSLIVNFGRVKYLEILNSLNINTEGKF